MQQNHSTHRNRPDTELDFYDILRILLNSKYVIILFTIVVTTIGFIYSSYFNSDSSINYEASAVMEIGSYPASDTGDRARDGRVLIASMEASTTLLNAMYGMNRLEIGSFVHSNDWNKDLESILIYELDSQYFVIEILGTSSDIVKNQMNTIIEYIKKLHAGRLNEVISKKKRALENIEEKLLTVDKFITTITNDNNIYISDVAELKLKEIEYNYEIKELNMHLSNIQSFRKTNLVKEIQYYTDYPKSNISGLTFASFIIGLILASLFVVMRHGFINNYKK